jgi:hypothetical protein
MYRLILSLAAMLPFALLGPIASAQGQWDRDRSYGGTGTYQDTCTDARWNGSVLSARCQRQDGGWRNSSIDTRNCSGQVLNINGHLSCGEANNGYNGYQNRPYDNDDRPYYNGDRGYREGTNQGYWEGGLPPGDYKLTCQDMQVDGDRLSASCQKRNGEWRRTSLDFDRCSSPIVNDNGHLTCTGR